MAIAVGATSKGRSASTTSQATTGVTTQASGSAFVVAFIWDTGNFSSIADSKSNTYTQIGTEQVNSDSAKIRAYYVENGTGGSSHTATVNLSVASPITVLFAEITGGLTSGILDQSDIRWDTASPYTLAAGLTTTQAAELLLSFLGGNSGSNPATHAESGLGSSTIQIEETNGASFYTAAIATSIKSSTGTFNPSWTETGSTKGGVMLATLKEAAGGGFDLRFNLCVLNSVKRAANF